MMAAIGSTPIGLYLPTHPVRPPGNRTPTPQEAGSACVHARQIELCDPEILVCWATAAQALLA